MLMLFAEVNFNQVTVSIKKTKGTSTNRKDRLTEERKV